MRLSIVIVNWNTSELLSACLQSICNFPPNGDYEIIVVDNNSWDLDADAFCEHHPGIRLIRNRENVGYARGNNQAIEQARGDYVLLLNPDTEVTEGAIETLLQFVEAHGDAGAAAPKLIRPDGTIDRSVRSFPYPGPIAWEYLRLAHLFPRSRRFGAYRMTWFGYDQTIEVDQPMGSALVLNRRALDQIGFFDESFPIFFNEVDLLYRAKENGWKVYFVHSATMIHHGGASTKQARRMMMLAESHKSLLRFYAKHFDRRIPALVYHFTVAAIRLSLLNATLDDWVLGKHRGR